MIIYDSEIKKAILGKGETPVPGIEYCAGFRDFKNMGCSVVGVYDYDEQRYRVFCDDNLQELQELVNQTDLVIGFNNIAFDDPLMEECGVTIPPEKSWDILAEIWNAAGLGRAFTSSDHKGFGLDACCKANFNTGKSGNGRFAPIDWQEGNIGTVIDYCLKDVALTKQLVDRIAIDGHILDPRDPSKQLWIDSIPFGPFDIDPSKPTRSAQSKLKQYFDWLARANRLNSELTAYGCPHCEKTICAQMPDLYDEYTSVSQCPYCNRTHFRTVFDNGSVKAKKRGNENE